MATSGTTGTDDGDKKAKSRVWVMTVFDEDGSRRAKLEDYPCWVKFLAYGDEVTSEGRPHYQCYVQTWEPVRWTQFDSWIGKCYRAVMRGSFDSNEQYCSKQGELKKFGEPPMQGRRTDIIGLKRRLDALPYGQNAYDLADEEPLYGHIRKYARFDNDYLSNRRMKQLAKDFTAPVVQWIVGPPGSGKTRMVREKEDTLYDVPSSASYGWFDGYKLQEAVLYDNLEFTRRPVYCDFLKQLDRYVIQVPVKGGFVPWKPRRIYITSTFLPCELYSDAPYEASELLRRISEVIRL